MMKYALPLATIAALTGGHALAQTVSAPTPAPQPSPTAEFASQLARLNVNVMEANAELQKQLVAANAEIADLKKKLNIPVERPKPADGPVVTPPNAQTHP